MNNIKQFLSSKKFMVILSFIGLYLISAGTSWALFTYLREEPNLSIALQGLEKARSDIAELPKTEECPINGGMFSVPEREIWETRRPLTVIIENHEDSRPLEGVHRADVVYEAVAEGGITRLLAVYYCDAAAENVRIAPVRSARIYFVNWAAEYGDNPIFAHVGGANNFCKDCPGGVKWRGQVAKEVRAVEELAALGWRVPRGNDFDTTYDSGFPEFFRDPERLNDYLEEGEKLADEHTVTSYTDDLWGQAEERGFAYKDSEGNEWTENYTSWKFKDGSSTENPKAGKISFEFWEDSMFSESYAVIWKYDNATNSYLRENGGEKQVDRISGEQFSAKNVVIQFIVERTGVDAEKHVFYKTIDDGDALIFQNGDVIEGSWEKKDQLDRTVFYDDNGDEIEFVRGTIWIEAVPVGNAVEF